MDTGSFFTPREGQSMNTGAIRDGASIDEIRRETGNAIHDGHHGIHYRPDEHVADGPNTASPNYVTHPSDCILDTTTTFRMGETANQGHKNARPVSRTCREPHGRSGIKQ